MLLREVRAGALEEFDNSLLGPTRYIRLLYSQSHIMEQPVSGTQYHGLISQPRAQSSPLKVMNTVWSEHRNSPTNNVHTNATEASLYGPSSTEVPVVVQTDAQSSGDCAELVAKRPRLLPPGNPSGYQPGTMNSMHSHSLAAHPNLNCTFTSSLQPETSLNNLQFDYKTTAPSYEGQVGTSNEAKEFLPSSPCLTAPDSKSAGASVGNLAVDRVEAAALLLGIRALGDCPSPDNPVHADDHTAIPERRNNYTARSAPLTRRAPPNDLAYLNEHYLAALGHSLSTSHFPPPPQPSSFFQVVDTRVTTLEGFYWSWLLTGPGLARDRAPLLPYSTPQTHSSVLPWPDFVLGEPSAAQTWSFV